MGGRLLGLLAGFITGLVFAVPAGAATIEVNETADERNTDGDCSLREAVQSANSNSSVDDCEKGKGGKPDSVRLAEADYELDLASTHEDLNANGDLDLGDPASEDDGGPLTIAGVGEGGTTVFTDLEDRVLDIHGGKVTIKELTLEDGEVIGLGGGNNLGGTVASTFTKLALREVQINSGEAAFGGGLAAGGGQLKMADTQVQSNYAAERGGGLYLSEAKATLKDSRVLSNDADSSTDSEGGGIFSSGGSLRILDTEVSGNGASDGGTGSAIGGGILSESDLDVRRSLFINNGALADTNGQSESGGGIFARGEFGDLKIAIVNSTFADNVAGDGDGLGGAIFISDGDATVAHSTFLSNEADAGEHVAAAGPPFLTLRNSILPGVQIVVDVCSGSVVSKGYNVANYDDSDCSFLDSDVFGSPGLVPGGPVDNGGPTDTIGIEGSSLAKDLVPKGKCRVADKEDQRGFERPKGPKCDAGAFERGAQP